MKTTKKRASFLIAILIAFSANLLLIEKVNSKEVVGSETFTSNAIADSFVNQSSPDTNYGNENRLGIKNNSYSQQSYVMFDLSGLPENAFIIEANMHLTLTDIDGYGSYGVTIGTHFCPDNSWSETGITWNNKPDFEIEPTATNGFWFVFLPKTDSWNITVDAQTAFTRDKKLTEVIMFEEPQTAWGSADLKSREVTGVELLIEYATKPIFAVQLESIQDTETTSNLGIIDFSSKTFTLPSELLVVNGEYDASYTGGYTFLQWETEGGITVENPNSQTTKVTVTGLGKLRAVGNAETLQYFYDDSKQDGTTYNSAGKMTAVRFTPLFLGSLKKTSFYIGGLSGSNPFKVHVMDENFTDVVPSFSQTASSTGWFEVDLSTYNIQVKNDFYIAVEWLIDSYPRLGQDQSNPDERSFEWNGTTWNIQGSKDYMIRAVVENDLPIKQIGIISCTSFSSVVTGGRSVTVSGTITPPCAGVEVYLKYTRPDGSTVVRTTLTISDGTFIDIFMPDKCGLWKVMASWMGNEDYEGSKSFPEEFSVNKGSLTVYLDYLYPSTITIGSSITITGSLLPQRSARIKLKYSLDEGETWLTFTSVTTSSNGEYTYPWTPFSTGNYRLRASWEGDDVSEESESREVSLTVEETEETCWVNVDFRSFAIKISCNSTLSDSSFSKSEKMISFQLKGVSDTVGYCNVSFPKELLGDPYTVLVDDSQVDFLSDVSNDEVTLYFLLNFESTCKVEVFGSTVIPEFTSFPIIAVFILAILFEVLVYRTKKLRK